MFVLSVPTRDWFLHQNIGTLHSLGYLIPAAAGGTPGGLTQQSVTIVPPTGRVQPDPSDQVLYLDSIQFTDVVIGQIQYTIQMGQHNLSGYAIEGAYIPVEMFCTGPLQWQITNASAQICVVYFTWISLPRASYDTYLAGMAKLSPMGQFGALEVR